MFVEHLKGLKKKKVRMLVSNLLFTYIGLWVQQTQWWLVN